MKSKILAQGAEAIILLKEVDCQGTLVPYIIKKRIKKSYRIPELDKKIRKLRTRAEARILKRASKIIYVPKVIGENEKSKELIIEHIKGKKLSEHLDNLKNKIQICKQIGETTAKLHDNNIIHSDLTTSNMILQEKTKKIYFIDFGLSYHSHKLEDKAVDIHLFKQALEAKHFKHYKQLLASFLAGYKKSKTSKEVLERLKKVESRGRYK